MVSTIYIKKKNNKKVFFNFDVLYIESLSIKEKNYNWNKYQLIQYDLKSIAIYTKSDHYKCMIKLVILVLKFIFIYV